MSLLHRPGDRVFAKIKGFSNWPARINPLPPDVPIPKGKLPVFFYGTYQVSFVPAKNIVPYDEFKNKWGKPKSNPQFMAAMEEIESNPGILMLGEDPRAEQFLLQFYTFKPSGATTSLPGDKQNQLKRPKDRPSNSPRSFSSMSPSPTREASSLSVKAQSNHGSKMSHHSETSSELSSALSKQGSTEVTAASDDDEEDEVPENVQSSLKSHLTPSSNNDRAGVSPRPFNSAESNGNEHSDLQNYEAQKLLRRIQKKAEKKALKKAAKKEAKRLAKEAERAERRARREAKRELKRLHKLEKRRMLEEGTVTAVPPSDGIQPFVTSDDEWATAVTREQLDLAEAPVFSPTADMPYDELIAAELEGSELSPCNDRPTSPLRLDDFLPVELCQEEENLDTTIMMRDDSASPSPWSPANDSPLTSNRGASKRSTSNFTHTTVAEPIEPELSTDDVELELSLSSKRARPELRRSSRKSSSGKAETANVEGNGISADKQSNSRRVRGSAKSRKRVSIRRRHLVDKDSDEDVKGHTEQNFQQLESLPPVIHESPSHENKTGSKSPFDVSSGPHEQPPFGSAIGKQHKFSEDTDLQQSKLNESNSRERHPVKQTPVLSNSPESRPSDPTSPGPPDVVTQLRQLCRDLKASLVRGHENFASAVQHLTHLTEIPIRLPQLAHVWDLMDCIKKCRRYKLSAEVREAAQNTLRFFQAVQNGATKEELSETQALIAAHQNRSNATPSEPVKQPPKRPPAGCLDSTKNIAVSSIPQTAISSVITTTTVTNSPVDSKAEQISADLAAKVDDMLSLIRATEERMAAASYSSAARLTNRPVTANSVSHESGPLSRLPDVPYDITHSIIRASAVAAAAAHMHDEEDEESVVSRIEQVAAYEEASKQSASILAPHLSPPPPPPPPPPPSASFTVHRISPVQSVDLDLDSRIEMLITGPKVMLDNRLNQDKRQLSSPVEMRPVVSRTSPSIDNSVSTLPSSLLARRQAIADKLAAKRASRKNEENSTRSFRSLAPPVDSGGNLPFASRANQSTSKDDELYDMLGV